VGSDGGGVGDGGVLTCELDGGGDGYGGGGGNEEKEDGGDEEGEEVPV